MGNPESMAHAKPLDIYFLDMMGGASVLIVTPFDESILIDTGSLRPENRDADRIFNATQIAGLKHIDYCITTHFHLDHFGAILPLTKKIRINRFMDKGKLPPEKEERFFKELYKLYQEATQGQVDAIKAGDDIPLKNDPAGKLPKISLHCVAAEKQIEGFQGDVDAPVPGFEIKKPDESDNARSIALILTYGDFKFFTGADITWNVEHHLAHPENKIGTVDLFHITHHGLDQSNNPILLKAIDPVVCIASNGPRKGIQPNTMRTLRELPNIQAIYQIHYNILYGSEGNTKPEYIANMKDPNAGEFIKVSVDQDAKIYTVSVGTDSDGKTFSITKKES